MADEKELETKTEDVTQDDLAFDAACKEAAETDEVKAEAEGDEEVKTEAEEDEVKTESDEEEVKAEAEGDEEVKTESDEDEVKAEDEPIEVKAEDDAEKAADEEVKTEEGDAEEDKGDYKLSEELNDLLKVELDPAIKEKIDTAFDTIVKEQIARLKEQLRADATKQVEESVKKLRESVKVYLEKAARTYIAENKLALKESLRLKYFESFFGKVKTLFKENYVELRESDEDALADLKKENDELKSKTDELVEDNTKLAESVITLKRQNQITKLASDMYLTESNRFKIASEKLLRESVKMSDAKFTEKLNVIAEMFSSKKEQPAKKKLLSEGKIQKTTVAEKASTDKKVDPFVASIINGF